MGYTEKSNLQSEHILLKNKEYEDTYFLNKYSFVCINYLF